VKIGRWEVDEVVFGSSGRQTKEAQLSQRECAMLRVIE